MNICNDMIFRFFFIFLDKKIIEKKSVTDTIFSQSFTSQADDVFCAYNSKRLYEITENLDKKFQIKNTIIDDECHQDIITTLLMEINNKETEYYEEIKSRFYLKNKQNNDESDKKVTFFVKILNFDIERSTYLKLEMNARFESSLLILNETEVARIILSHLFSYVNNQNNFLGKLMILFGHDRFNLEKFTRELERLDKEYDHKNLTPITQSYINKPLSHELVHAKYESLSVEIKTKKDGDLSIRMRNFINFFYIFYRNTFFIIYDDNEKNVIQFYWNKNAEIPFKMHYKNFLKICNHFDLPVSMIIVEKYNFMVLNTLLENIYFGNREEEIVLDLSEFLKYDSVENFSYFSNNSESMLFFFKQLCINEKQIIQLGELQFNYNMTFRNFILTKSSFKKLKSSTINNHYLLACIDLYTFRDYKEIPSEFKLLMDIYVKISMIYMKKHGLCMKIHTLMSRKKKFDKFTNKVKKKLEFE